jgi:hypothetical protein
MLPLVDECVSPFTWVGTLGRHIIDPLHNSVYQLIKPPLVTHLLVMVLSGPESEVPSLLFVCNMYKIIGAILIAKCQTHTRPREVTPTPPTPLRCMAIMLSAYIALDKGETCTVGLPVASKHFLFRSGVDFSWILQPHTLFRYAFQTRLPLA